MNNSSGVWKFIGIALVVIVVSLAGGYYFSGSQQHATTPTTASDQTGDSTAPPASSATPAPQAVATSSEYTAPDAPSIDIKEVKPSALPKKNTKAPDSEASQTGVLPVANPTPSMPDATASAPVPDADSTPPPVTPTPTAPPPPPPAPPTAVIGDGLAPSIPPPAQPPAVDDGGSPANTETGPIFHVLVGNTFADSRNAHIYAASLQHRGYIAVVESINSGSGTVYKVQVGAYRNRVAAEDEVNQLQQSGFNAYVATDR